MRSIRLFLVLALVMSILSVSLYGCSGGNQGKAEEYMVDGDHYYDSAIEYFNSVFKTDQEFNDEATEMIKAQKTMEPTSWQQSANNINSSYDKAIGVFQQSKAEFEKIKTLKDVPDYVGYADLMIPADDAMIGVVNSRKALIQWWVDTFTNSRQTLAANAQAIVEQLAQLSSSSRTQTDSANALHKQAQEYKKSKNL